MYKLSPDRLYLIPQPFVDLGWEYSSCNAHIDFEKETDRLSGKPILISGQAPAHWISGEIVKEGEYTTGKRSEFYKGAYMNECVLCKEMFSNTDKLWFVCQKCCDETVAIPINVPVEEEIVDWTVQKDGVINVPDEFDRLVNYIGNQFQFVKHSGKNWLESVCDIAFFSQKFFKKYYEENKNVPVEAQKEESLTEIEKPVGDYILNSGVIGMLTAHGTYYHYKDVCKIINQVLARKEEAPVLNVQDELTSIENEIQSFIDATDNQMLIKGLRECKLIVQRHKKLVV